jgi:lipopolysaccharide transport system permease protein
MMARATANPDGFEFVAEPTRGWPSPNFRQLWQYRELIAFLAWRDVIVRYKQSLFGITWVVIQPLVAMIVFSIIFGQFAKLPSDGIPYPVFTYAALLPWQLWASAVNRAGNSLVGSSNLLTKVYFPRLILPLAATLASVVDFGVSLAVLFVLLAIFRVWPSWPLLLLPLFTALAILTSLAVGIWLAALNVRYRDVTYVMAFLIQISLYVSPVAYSSHLVPSGKWRLIYALNPLAGVIQGFRWALVRGPAPDATLLVGVAVVLVLLITGIYYFRRTEKTFGDVV